MSLSSHDPLRGITVLRFAHAYATGGGTERYLDDLDRSLLERSSARIIRVFLTRDPHCSPVTEQQIGKGTLVQIPLPTVSAPNTGDASAGPTKAEGVRDFIRRRILRNPIVWRVWARKWNLRRPLPRLPGQAIGAGAATRRLFAERPVDLVVLHYAGGADAEEVLHSALGAKVPCIYLNHYANDRLEHLAIRKHLELMQGVAGVNALDVPADLRSEFANLSDGIDTDFFSRASLEATPRSTPRPVLFLPARITREKGQLDLLKVLRALVRQGLDCEVALAGRIDASSFPEELKAYAVRHGLASRLRFLGDLGLVDLRRAYAEAALVVFPTYHCEGLGRITLESQAMGTPALAYGTGGVAEGIDDGITGYVVPTGDIRGLTAHTAHLLRHPSERDRLGAAGRKMVVARFSLPRLAERHEVYYQRIIARGANALPKGY